MPSELYIRTSSNGYTALYGSYLGELVQSLAIPDFEFGMMPGSTNLHPLHITLITKSEAQQVYSEGRPHPFADSVSSEFNLIPQDLLVMGLGGRVDRSLLFVVVIINSLAFKRTQAGLPRKDFHISLRTPPRSSPDDFEHGLDTLFQDPLEYNENRTSSHFDHLALHHQSRSAFTMALEVARRGTRQFPIEGSLWIRMGDAAIRLQLPKLAMLAYGTAYRTTESEKAQRYCVKSIVRCAKETEWGQTFTDAEGEQLASLDPRVWIPWTEDLKESIKFSWDETISLPTLCLDPREKVFLRSHEENSEDRQLMRYFRWIIPFHLAVSSTPRHEDDVKSLELLGIRHILTLTEETPLPSSWFEGRSITYTFLPIPNMRSPTNAEYEIFLRLATNENSTPLLVHCGGGKGRAGSMIAAYLLAFGFSRPESTSEPWHYPKLSATQAMQALREIRPGSIESHHQEEGIKGFAKLISKRGSVLPVPIAEPQEDRQPSIVGSLPISPDLVVLIGLPGSGKSFFREALVKRDRSWTYVSGDEDGTRGVFETVARQALGSRTIIDRCNSKVDDRKQLLQLAHFATNPIAVFFDFSTELCIQRAQNRAGHPSLRPGSRVEAAVKQFASTMTRPTLDEGFKAIFNIRSIEAGATLVRRLSPPIGLLKFPRTPHLINLGSATDDDLIINRKVSTSNQDQLPNIVVTEKADGANLGFSLSSERSIVVQNRSHYITSGAQFQFKALDRWIEQHREELNQVLGRDDSFPERYILYGEWMSAVHSVYYDALPDSFLAFDLYDRVTGSFNSRQRLDTILDPTTIHRTPVLYKGPELPMPKLLEFIQTKSNFTNDEKVRMEGVYVKWEAEGVVKERGKIVRGDFITGNEHWTKGKIEFNKIVRPTT